MIESFHHDKTQAGKHRLQGWCFLTVKTLSLMKSRCERSKMMWACWQKFEITHVV